MSWEPSKLRAVLGLNVSLLEFEIWFVELAQCLDC